MKPHEIDWSAAPIVATHLAPAFERFGLLWAKLEDGKYLFHEGDKDDVWYVGAQPGIHESFIERPQAWSGHGLPPVGDNVQNSNDIRGYSNVIATHNGGAIIEQMDGVAADFLWFSLSQCKPIRTKDQIEAEEREEEILQLKRTLHSFRRETHEYTARQLHNAGYRKSAPMKTTPDL